MNLVIDQGNTVCKLAVFDSGNLLWRETKSEPAIPFLKEIMADYPEISAGILSSVGMFDPEIQAFLKKILKTFIILDATTPLPIVNNYSSKDTLGYDRIADAVGAFSLFPGNNVLIIDAGTAITIDLLTSKGEFYGGNISPGLDLRFKSLHNFTKKLPLVEKESVYPLLGRSTREAILAGVINGVTFEIEGYIDMLKSEFIDLKIILTGGDIKYFDKKLKNSIFANSNLNLTGLNRILEYNVENH